MDADAMILGKAQLERLQAPMVIPIITTPMISASQVCDHTTRAYTYKLLVIFVANLLLVVYGWRNARIYLVFSYG